MELFRNTIGPNPVDYFGHWFDIWVDKKAGTVRARMQRCNCSGKAKLNEDDKYFSVSIGIRTACLRALQRYATREMRRLDAKKAEAQALYYAAWNTEAQIISGLSDWVKRVEASPKRIKRYSRQPTKQ